MANNIEKNNGEIIIYQSEDGKIRLDVRLEEKTVWLTQGQIAQLYGKGRSTITEHISNVFKEGELEKEKVCRKIRHTTQHGAMESKTQSQEVTLYNLDVIISVGYRVKSVVGTRFRQWEQMPRNLNNLVSGYFDFAETQALRHRPMYMDDYVRQLDS